MSEVTTPTGPTGGPPPRRHLMTPGNPRNYNGGQVSLSRVQRWVMSTLAATTIMHLAAGLAVAAYFSEKTSAKVGLLIIAGAFGVIAMMAALLIHRKSLLSPWLLLGVLPAVVGAFFVV